MSSDPRGACPKLIDKNNRILVKKRGVFDAIGNLGELEVLEEIGVVNNNTRRGLTSIATASNIIRTGNPSNDGIVKALSRTAVTATEVGADIVLDATGIGRAGLDTINAIDANVANRALGAAKQVFKKAKSGEFGIQDIPDALADIQNVESLLRGVFKGDIKSSNPLARFKCQPSPYALDLVHRAPKMKFMYIVELNFTEPYSALNRVAATMAFITKSAGRPQVDFEYEEVNMYNYRTQVLKRTTLQPMQLRFTDDVQGNSIRFYEMYLKAMSPISNIDPAHTYSMVGQLEDNAMNFDGLANPVQFSERFPDQQVSDNEDQRTRSSNAEAFYQAKSSLEAKINGVRNTLTNFATFGTPNTYDNGESDKWYRTNGNGTARSMILPQYAASAGAPQAGTGGLYHKQMLESITLHHIGDYGDTITSYKMVNPRITSFQPDELTMAESGDGSELIFDFNYDALLISANQPMWKFGPDKLHDITGGTVGATYPIYQTGISTEPKSEGGGMNPTIATSGEVTTDTTNRTSATRIPNSEFTQGQGNVQDVVRFRDTPSVDRGDGFGTFDEAPFGLPR